MKFEYGKSYLYLFLAFVAFWIGLVAISETFAWSFNSIKPFLPLWPLFLLFLLVSQLRSKIALNSYWVAKHPAGTWEYSCLIAWNTLLVVVGCVLVAIAIETKFPPHS